jgi:hypothetical protein
MNLCGRHAFTKAPESIPMAAIMQAFAEAPVPLDFSLSAPKYTFLGGHAESQIMPSHARISKRGDDVLRSCSA